MEWLRSWMVIGGVTLLVALASNLFRPKDVKWFRRLQRPDWLTFEWAIPVIWTVVFICGAWSAYIIWENDPGTTRTWLLMGFYLLVEIAIISYTPVMFRTRSLKMGTIIGATGTLLGAILALTVLPISGWAAVLLLPYLIWSPIGTFTTWQMMQLNPADA
ncbi:TspO/MBR family protein [Desertifilum sp. FACHB-1129]|uniref:TspO protein n=2 Tax=Desertifilum tharense IPPAS B-1220 TaxID=1781255 RepID=A0A1E5QD91_9CYAN|nr:MULTISPECIES: TspO/MBR family protein [Desertifilum]MDA0212351.1 TspO/MBR family protein [Cyanobacteria bacterium FC1]MBD2311318.1 TspO/MBR family protein [Desertifilum sp. FACHB-1129]MBD2321564.1 TspO/MBR family protein [Desertifilum sp. FACHB-866]MBD2331691.1 TspO/MBR family protein [Desertifilum sp. FACHB-868]OEJ72632.1 TspO protein [Desertifilum tharense IPPAS B-1220]